jgi:RNA polymerase sigma-70 factor (ECF subfamily)
MYHAGEPMTPVSTESVEQAIRAFAERAHRRTRAGEWGLSAEDFGGALSRSVQKRFEGQAPPARDVDEYLASLQLEDLALACACARGSTPAWEHFVGEFRPILLRLAGQHAPPDAARDVADSIYAELFGLEARDGERRSLFDYFHGRSTLAGWLRAVVSQRLVDRARAERRLEPLPEPGSGSEPSCDPGAPDVDRVRLLPLVREAVLAAVAALEARDRLRLALYYAQGVKLAAIGRILGESEATSSRKLERTRHDLRARIERHLRDRDGLGVAEIEACFEYARTDPAFDLARTLPPE